MSAIPSPSKPVTPWVTLASLEALIANEAYHHFPDTQVVVCCLQLTNGFAVVDYAVCANPDHFDPQVGRQQARRKALNQLLEFEHYSRRQKLAAVTGDSNHD